MPKLEQQKAAQQMTGQFDSCIGFLKVRTEWQMLVKNENTGRHAIPAGACIQQMYRIESPTQLC